MSSLFDNIRKPWAAWEMTMEAHDPTNNRTLDLSGNWRHLTLGNGAGANAPTKLAYRKGYQSSAVTDKLTQDATTQWGTNRITVEVLFYSLPGSQSTFDVVELFGAGGTSFLVLKTTTSLRFYSGGASANNAASYPSLSGGRNVEPLTHIIGRYDGTNTSILVNGNSGTNAVTPLAPNAVNPAQALRLFSRYSDISFFKGNMYFCRLWDVALTNTEMQELSRKAKQELHRI